MSAYLIANGCCVLIMVPLLSRGVPGVISALAFIGSVLINNLWPLTYSFTAELNPTEARNIAVGSGSSFGRMCGLVAPYMPLLSVYWYGLPYLVLGSVPVIVGLLCFLLPETKGRRLPDTLKDAELFGTEQYDNMYQATTNDEFKVLTTNNTSLEE
ncbi:unnamed protein product [Owenia fusiformis]|uniref:Uncharacterized protein n=1 Tax=Owenia fusiformis TaxID=6347 RepID=A0A8J1UW27_OWEFU|nr:unnamed protein product [Owenia fusiformis]